MNMLETNPTLYQKISDNHIDYSEIYRTQETLQLNKRLRKTRIALLISAFVLIAGDTVLLAMPETSFAITNLLGYIGVGAFFVILSFFSYKQPFFTVVAALIACLGLWGLEVFSDSMSELIVETSIHKLLVISLLVWRFHPSREAELIRRELDFS